jgi:D-tyrosyl-tRNA(Tyr) deacylase
MLKPGSRVSVGHVCPKHFAGLLDAGLLGQMLERSGGEVSRAFIDWKSLNAEGREAALRLLKDYNLPYGKV